jgi:oligoribonuclease NrnB/cAMP/cGMP phosphodiesterase (DHH superfamily)
MKTTVIYHSADFDGLFCREIAGKFLPDADLIGWDYGQPLIPFPQEGFVYILDLSPECLDKTPWGQSLEHWKRIIWIDHHKSAIDKFDTNTNGLKIAGYRIDGVSACRLAWQWFCYESQGMLNGDFALPDKQHFIDRQVSEPYAVQLAGEYDIWDKRNPMAEIFQLGLRSRELTASDWKILLSNNPDNFLVSILLGNGELLQTYQRRNDALSMNNSFLVDFEGLKFLALNTQAKSSLAFMSKDVPETDHDALLKFSWNGKLWDCSMYHAKHRTDLDLSQIAVKHGGGGHRGACGFRAEKLPFLP